MQNRIYDAAMLLVIAALVLLFAVGCAGSLGKKGMQGSLGIATADATGEVESEGFSEGGVQVIGQGFALVGRLAEAALRMPFAVLQGAANGAAQPMLNVLDEKVIAPVGAASSESQPVPYEMEYRVSTVAD